MNDFTTVLACELNLETSCLSRLLTSVVIGRGFTDLARSLSLFSIKLSVLGCVSKLDSFRWKCWAFFGSTLM